MGLGATVEWQKRRPPLQVGSVSPEVSVMVVPASGVSERLHWRGKG